ncbi:MAG TPA: VanW family protein [Candidatus Saccharimonadales bacterium]|nr:VanW family protein [Candidatus Saccharimonadales bacterium]
MTKSKKTAFIAAALALFLLLAIFFITYLNWTNANKERLPKNTMIGGIDFGEQTKEEVNKTLEANEETVREQGINFQHGGKIVNLPLKLESSASADIPDVSTIYADAIVYNKEKTITTLFINKNNNFLKYLQELLPFFNSTTNYEAVASYSPTVIEQWLKENFDELNIPPEPAFFSLDNSQGNWELINNQEKIGKEINEDELFNDLINNLKVFNNNDISIKTRSKYPDIKREDLELVRSGVQMIIDGGDLNIFYNNAKRGKISWTVKIKEIITWISVKKGDNVAQIDFNQTKIREYLLNTIAKDVDEDAVLPRFEIKDGKVTSWQQGISGREVDLEASANLLTSILLGPEREAELIVKDINISELEAENNFKIKELLGTGHSNFIGSPANRRHNIAVGAAAIQGLLIKPGEEFSLVKTLGEIDASTGYLPELVIKDNKTIPEYGGGLCQVATTIFRSALASGLPITARRNHSYRVSYYEPAGTDAAVYDPWPDVKFVNDTGSYVLIQSRIAGNDIYFDFWGTSDGRIASTTAPTIYNITRPKPTKIVETDTLAPGEKKCTEHAHNGADAYFDYTVIYPEGATTTPEQVIRFSSHYVPWQEVCLVGKATSTPEISGNSELGATSSQPSTASSTSNIE